MLWLPALRGAQPGCSRRVTTKQLSSALGQPLFVAWAALGHKTALFRVHWLNRGWVRKESRLVQEARTGCQARMREDTARRLLFLKKC